MIITADGLFAFAVGIVLGLAVVGIITILRGWK